MQIQWRWLVWAFMASQSIGGPATAASYNPFLIEAKGSGPRAGQVEFYGLGQYASLGDITKPGVSFYHPTDGWVTGDVAFDYDAFWSGGFGIAYNLNNYFTVKGEFTYGTVDYTAGFRDSWLAGEMQQSGGTFNLDYNVLSTPLTPFLSAGLGYQYFDSGIPSGPPDYYYCWWDYYWGWVCTGDTPTYTDTYFTLNAQGGLRWDISRNVFAKVWGGAGWMCLGDGAGWPVMLQGSFALGAKF